MGTDEARKVAAFDFDGTLTHRDTLVPFMGRTAGWVRVGSTSALIGLDAIRRRVAVGDRDEVKAEMLRRLFGGRTEAELRDLGAAYADQILASQKINTNVSARIEQHLGAGHEVVFVSASLVYYLEPIAEKLGVHHVIGVELENRDGLLTGALAHPNVRAEQKAIRLREWLGEDADGPLAKTELWAYGNSSGDYDLLALADHSYWLGKPSKAPTGVVVFDPTEMIA